MLKFVHRPVLKRLVYDSINLIAVPPQSTALLLLGRIGRTVVPHWDYLTGPDPRNFGIHLPAGGHEEQLVKFKRRADHIYEELGPWAADYFILESIKALSESFNAEDEFLLGFKHAEKTKLIQVLGQIPSLMSSSTVKAEDNIRVSPKAESLILFLADQDSERCSGLVFVKQRATVSVLNALLSRHSHTKNKFRCTTFVGLSTSAKRRYSMAELLDLKAQREALTELRAKVKNLIIATDVLEEGIDVTACNLVVCFDVPANLKSFVQRRGRARQEQSTFAILLDGKGENKDKIPLWQHLEAEMIRLYQDVTRLTENGLVADEEPDENVEFEINVPATG
jgi:ERCC4-related helicase